MNQKFKETLYNKDRFLTYGLAAVTLVKCTEVIAARGGDMEAISLFLEGISKLQQQLREAIPDVKQGEIKNEIEELFRDLGLK